MSAPPAPPDVTTLTDVELATEIRNVTAQISKIPTVKTTAPNYKTVEAQRQTFSLRFSELVGERNRRIFKAKQAALPAKPQPKLGSGGASSVQVAQLQADLQAEQQRVVAAQTQVSKLIKDLTDTEAARALAVNNLNIKTIDDDAKIRQLDGFLRKANDEVVALKATGGKTDPLVAAANTAKAQAEQNLATAQNELQQARADAKTAATNAATAIKGFETTITTLRADVTKLTAQKEAAEKSVATLETTIADLEKQLVAANASKESAVNQNGTLQTQIVELQRQLAIARKVNKDTGSSSLSTGGGKGDASGGGSGGGGKGDASGGGSGKGGGGGGGGSGSNDDDGDRGGAAFESTRLEFPLNESAPATIQWFNLVDDAEESKSSTAVTLTGAEFVQKMRSKADGDKITVINRIDGEPILAGDKRIAAELLLPAEERTIGEFLSFVVDRDTILRFLQNVVNAFLVNVSVATLTSLQAIWSLTVTPLMANFAKELATASALASASQKPGYDAIRNEVLQFAVFALVKLSTGREAVTPANNLGRRQPASENTNPTDAFGSIFGSVPSVVNFDKLDVFEGSPKNKKNYLLTKKEGEKFTILAFLLSPVAGPQATNTFSKLVGLSYIERVLCLNVFAAGGAIGLVAEADIVKRLTRLQPTEKSPAERSDKSDFGKVFNAVSKFFQDHFANAKPGNTFNVPELLGGKQPGTQLAVVVNLFAFFETGTITVEGVASPIKVAAALAKDFDELARLIRTRAEKDPETTTSNVIDKTVDVQRYVFTAAAVALFVPVTIKGTVAGGDQITPQSLIAYLGNRPKFSTDTTVQTATHWPKNNGADATTIAASALLDRFRPTFRKSLEGDKRKATFSAFLTAAKEGSPSTLDRIDEKSTDRWTVLVPTNEALNRDGKLIAGVSGRLLTAAHVFKGVINFDKLDGTPNTYENLNGQFQRIQGFGKTGKTPIVGFLDDYGNVVARAAVESSNENTKTGFYFVINGVVPVKPSIGQYAIPPPPPFEQSTKLPASPSYGELSTTYSAIPASASSAGGLSSESTQGLTSASSGGSSAESITSVAPQLKFKMGAPQTDITRYAKELNVLFRLLNISDDLVARFSKTNLAIFLPPTATLSEFLKSDVPEDEKRATILFHVATRGQLLEALEKCQEEGTAFRIPTASRDELVYACKNRPPLGGQFQDLRGKLYTNDMANLTVADVTLEKIGRVYVVPIKRLLTLASDPPKVQTPFEKKTEDLKQRFIDLATAGEVLNEFRVAAATSALVVFLPEAKLIKEFLKSKPTPQDIARVLKLHTSTQRRLLGALYECSDNKKSMLIQTMAGDKLRFECIKQRSLTTSFDGSLFPEDFSDTNSKTMPPNVFVEFAVTGFPIIVALAPINRILTPAADADENDVDGNLIALLDLADQTTRMMSTKERLTFLVPPKTLVERAIVGNMDAELLVKIVRQHIVRSTDVVETLRTCTPGDPDVVVNTFNENGTLKIRCGGAPTSGADPSILYTGQIVTDLLEEDHSLIGFAASHDIVPVNVLLLPPLTNESFVQQQQQASTTSTSALLSAHHKAHNKAVKELERAKTPADAKTAIKTLTDTLESSGGIAKLRQEDMTRETWNAQHTERREAVAKNSQLASKSETHTLLNELRDRF